MYDVEGMPPGEDVRDLFGRYQRPLPDYAASFDFAPATKRPPKVSLEERAQRRKDLEQKLKDGVVRIQKSDDFRNYLIAMARFHAYSWHNQLLIWMQRPDATLVRGFQGWKDFGRYVKAGEKGIKVQAPQGPTTEVTWVHPLDGRTWIIKKDNGRYAALEGRKVAKTGKTRQEVVSWLHNQGAVQRKEVIAVQRFVDVSVFDIKQTDGKPLPEFEVPVLTGAMNRELHDGMLSVLKKRGVTVSFDRRPDIAPDIKGYFRHPDQIWVRPEEAPAQQLKSLIHEAAHYYSMGPFGMPRQDAETIAESVAFVVAAHYGFDTGVRSFPYVALWARDEKTLDKNLKAINKVSEHMIEELESVDVHLPAAHPIPRERPSEPTQPRPEPTPAPRLRLEQMESTHSLEQLKQMAREKGVSPTGSKRDIIRRLL